MALIAMATLQREFGLSFAGPSTVRNEHRTLATRRDRALVLPAIACNVVLLAAYLLGRHWPALTAQPLLPAVLLLVALLPGVLHRYLRQRDVRAPILAAAPASRGKAATLHE